MQKTISATFKSITNKSTFKCALSHLALSINNTVEVHPHNSRPMSTYLIYIVIVVQFLN